MMLPVAYFVFWVEFAITELTGKGASIPAFFGPWIFLGAADFFIWAEF